MAPPSPGWHRRRRRQRSLWRLRLHTERGKRKPNLGLIRHLAAALGKHHSSPKYRELMPKDRTWQWPQTAQSWDHQKNASKSKGKGKAKESGGPSFPNYDHGMPSESSSPPSSSKDSDLKAALSAIFADRKLEVPQELQCYLQPQPGDLIQSDQKILNAKRKLLGKVDRLTKALARKKDQWQNFRAQLKEHLCKEQARYDADVHEIQLALDYNPSTVDSPDGRQRAGDCRHGDGGTARDTHRADAWRGQCDPACHGSAPTLGFHDRTAPYSSCTSAANGPTDAGATTTGALHVADDDASECPIAKCCASARLGHFQGPFTHHMKTRAVPPMGPYSKGEDPKHETKEKRRTTRSPWT